MCNVIVLDFETFWDSKNKYSLSSMGPIEYIRDPRFEAQLLGFSINGVVRGVLEGNQILPFLQGLELHLPDRVVVGHNLNGFDALVLSEHYGIRPARMIDTILLSRWVGLARVCAESHMATTAALHTGTKTPGTAISNGKHWPHDFTEREREEFKKYCGEDVSQCEVNWMVMLAFGIQHNMFADGFDDFLRFVSLTARMATEPVFEIDADILHEYLADLEREEKEAFEQMCGVFKFRDKVHLLSSLRSPQVMCNMLKALGVTPPDKISETKTATRLALLRNKYEIEPTPELLDQINDPAKHAVYTPAFSKQDREFTDLVNHPDPRVALLVQSRLGHNSSIKRSRAERFLALAATGNTLPIMLSAFKAHTGRYAAGVSEGRSDRTQMQNLSKRDPRMAKLRKAIKAPEGYKVVAVDSSQIEARLLAYIARQDDLLEQFKTGEDPYSIMAEKIFKVAWRDIKAGAAAGIEPLKTYRSVGKICVLSAGYGVGAKKFSDTLIRDKARLAASIERHQEIASEAHSIYRQTNSQITALWKRCSQVIDHLIVGGSGVFGGPNDNLFSYGVGKTAAGGDAPYIAAPNGARIWYPGLHSRPGGKFGNEYIYYSQAGGSKLETYIYGGKVVENITQFIAFQLLIWQACRMDERGVSLAANNHDAWISVVPKEKVVETEKIMVECMSMVPPWLPDFPVACESEIGDDYSVA